MLEKIKKIVFQKYAKTDCKWVFISAFSDNWQVAASAWALHADKSLEDALDTIYRWVIEKNSVVSHIVVDIVLEYKEIMDMSEIQSLSVKEYWVAIVEGNKSWAILPDTKGVSDFAQWIKLVSEKNWLSWNAKILVFKTDRMVIF